MNIPFGLIKLNTAVLLRILCLNLILGGCTTTPVEYPVLQPGYAQPPRDDGGFTTLTAAIENKYGREHSGFLLIDRNEEALRWRLTLIDSAKHTLDLQYYLWYPDDSARLISTRLLAAADRGVRVRIILDDLMVIDNDKAVAGFDQHPNIEVRLFNPWDERESLLGRGMEALERMERLNFRMHNKLLIADNQAVILGGRNLGNYYFGLSRDYNFHDLDVLGIGVVASQTSEIFYNFWNSKWVSMPFAVGEQPSAGETRTAIEKVHRKLENSDRLHRFELSPRDWKETLAGLQAELVPGTSEMVFDTVESGEKITKSVAGPIRRLGDRANAEILIVNAYLIPSSMDSLKKITDRGVKVRILTNSLESNDVPAVNSHYKEWRKPIIETGAELYEVRADGAIQQGVVDTPPVQAEFMGLHTKALVVDRQAVFIGSVNFDPRSVNINTEMGVIIESPELAEQLAVLMERDMSPENSWAVQLDGDGDLYWESSRGIEHTQPARTFGQRIMDVLFMMFPKELY